MKAVVFDNGQARLDPARCTPKLREDCILVRPVAVALNPTDWKTIKDKRAKNGCILGCDYAGVVEAVGSAVGKDWKVGDNAFGCGHGGNFVNPDDGVFAQLITVPGDLQMRKPDTLTFGEAATMGLGTITVGQGLYQKALKLHLSSGSHSPGQETPYVLIYGGVTATGALAIQFAKQSGYRVITTCSPSNFDYVKSLGADFVFDYHNANVGEAIRSMTNDTLKYAWDTVSVIQSARICADALTSKTQLEPLYGAILPVECPREDIQTTVTVMYTAFGRHFKFGPRDMPASQEDYEFARTFFKTAETLISQGHVRPHRHNVRAGGFSGIIEGLKDMEEGRVRAEKLVFTIDQ